MPSFFDKNFVEKLWNMSGENAFTDEEKTKLTHFFNHVIRASARNRTSNNVGSNENTDNVNQDNNNSMF